MLEELRKYINLERLKNNLGQLKRIRGISNIKGLLWITHSEQFFNKS